MVYPRYMTEKEKKEFVETYDHYNSDPEDNGVMLEAAEKSGIFINDFIHIKLMKRACCREAKCGDINFTADEYISVAKEETEEARRKKLADILATKLIERNKEMDTKEAPEFIAEADEENGVHVVNGVDATRLLSYIERIERIEEEKKALQIDIKEIFEEAKAANFDVKAIRTLLKLRKKDGQELQEEEFILDQYRRALGM